MLTKEQILQLCELKTKEIEVAEFGGTVTIRELTIEDVSSIYRETQACPEDERGYQDIIRTVSAGMAEPSFTVDEIAGFSKRFSEVVVKIYKAIGDLSGANKIEELEKNSEPALTANS